LPLGSIIIVSDQVFNFCVIVLSIALGWLAWSSYLPKAWSAAILPARCKSESCRKTFEKALAQIEAAVREHGATVEELVVRVRSGAISEARFIAEMVSLRQAFEKVVGNSRRRPKAARLLQLHRSRCRSLSEEIGLFRRAARNSRFMWREWERRLSKNLPRDRAILVSL
jgi:hypothetical protein